MPRIDSSTSNVKITPYRHSVVVEGEDEFEFVPGQADLAIHFSEEIDTSTLSCPSQPKAHSGLQIDHESYEDHIVIELRAACRLTPEGSLCLRTLLALDAEPPVDSGWTCSHPDEIGAITGVRANGGEVHLTLTATAIDHAP